MRRLLLALGLLTAIGCADGTSTLDVTVTASGGTVSDVDHLRVVVTNPQGQMSQPLTVAVPDHTLPPAVSFALRLPATVRGKVHVAVDAVAADMTTVSASIAGDAEVAPSTRTSLPLTIALPGTPIQLAFLVQPSDTAIGVTIKPPVQVALQDADGNTVTTASAMVTIALSAKPSPATLGGTLTAMATNGVASFGDLTLDRDGNGYTLAASSGSLTPATSTPFNVRPPVWVQATNGIFGGDVNALAASGTPTIFYAGTAISGVFVSTNGGSTWVGAQSGLPLSPYTGLYSTVHAIAIDPTNAKHALAATDAGVYVTTNAGTSWTLAYDATPSAAWYSAAFDPTTPSHVFIGGFKVMKSIDGGGIWTDDITGLGTGTIRSIAVGGTSVLATTYNNNGAGSNGGVYRQPTSGGTWARDAGWPTATFAGSYPQQVATYDGIHAIAVCDSGNFFTNNSGATWTRYTQTPSNLPDSSTGLSITYDPTNSSKAYIGNIGDATHSGLWYSTDGGTTWNGFIDALAALKVKSIAVDPNATGNVFAAVDTGIYLRPSNGSDSLAVAGLTARPISALVAVGANVYAGTTLTALFRTTDGGMNWGPSSGSGAGQITASSGVIGALTVDPVTPGTVYAGQTNTGVWKSVDGGGSWSNVGTTAAGLTSQSVSSLVIAPQNPMLIYAGTGAGLFKSTNAGVNWTSGNLTGVISAIVFDPGSSSTLYVAGGANINKTTTGGTSWNPMNLGLPGTASFTALAMDAANAMTLYTGTASGEIFKTTDGAANWSAAGTLGGTVNMLAAHPTQAGLVYASTSKGMFRTTDGGATWSAFNVGLGDLDALTVTFDRANPTLVYVGTVGGGVYKAMP